jgi:hypothetical protein
LEKKEALAKWEIERAFVGNSLIRTKKDREIGNIYMDLLAADQENLPRPELEVEQPDPYGLVANERKESRRIRNRMRKKA